MLVQSSSLGRMRALALTAKSLQSFRPLLERLVAGCLPASANVITVSVTKIQEVASASVEKLTMDGAIKPPRFNSQPRPPYGRGF